MRKERQQDLQFWKQNVSKVHEREIPALKADEVLIKNGACNICTTDYGQYTGARKI